MEKIKVYGADWCSMTTRSLQHLDQLGVQYDYVDIDGDEAGAEWVRQHNDGKEKKPTIDIKGTVLTEPSNAQLSAALREKGLLQG